MMHNVGTQQKLTLAVLLLVSLVVGLFTLYVVDKAQPNVIRSHTLTGNASEQPQIHWKLVTTWPKNFPGLGRAPELLAEAVHRMSHGRMNISVHGAGEIVPALGVFDAVSSGSVQMGHGASYYWKGKIPASVFFTAIPFGMNAQEMNAWFEQGNGLSLWREIYQPFNLIPFPAGNTGVQMAGWFNRKIERIEDLHGLKMRIPGLGGEVFTRAGGTAVTIPGGELFTAMQTGVIDATEWVGPYNDMAMGFHQVAQYYYYPGWHEPGAALELIVNKTAFEQLPADLQAVVEVAAQRANLAMLNEYTARNPHALKQLRTEHGVKVLPLPADVLDYLHQTALEIYDEMAQKDPTFAKVYADYQAFAAQVARYHKISEHAYYRTR